MTDTTHNEGGAVTPYYQDEWATIYHGDCEEVMPYLGSFDLLLTDPPYGLGERLRGGTWGATRVAPITWDSASVPRPIEAALARCEDAVIWGGNYYVLPPSRGWLAWYKPDAVQTMADIELAWTTRDMNARLLRQSIAATNAERVGHPTQKPLAVMAWSLSFFPAARTVLDPFMGSGTTLRAAKDRGVFSLGIEMEERYCEIAARRLSQEVLDLGAA